MDCAWRAFLRVGPALRIAQDTREFFAAVLDMRSTAATADLAALDRVLENESLVLCRAAQEGLQRIMAADLSHFRARDLYTMLALGRAEATPTVFAAVFDRLLLPKWKAESHPGASLVAFLDRTNNWELRDFASGALAAHRFEGLLAVAGREVVDRLARGLDRTRDPLRESTRLAGIVDAAAGAAFRQQLASIVSEEFLHCQTAGDLRGATIYGLLAARLSGATIAAPYLPFFQSSESLDTALLFGKEKRCVAQRAGSSRFSPMCRLTVTCRRIEPSKARRRAASRPSLPRWTLSRLSPPSSCTAAIASEWKRR